MRNPSLIVICMVPRHTVKAVSPNLYQSCNIRPFPSFFKTQLSPSFSEGCHCHLRSLELLPHSKGVPLDCTSIGDCQVAAKLSLKSGLGRKGAELPGLSHRFAVLPCRVSFIFLQPAKTYCCRVSKSVSKSDEQEIQANMTGCTPMTDGRPGNEI